MTHPSPAQKSHLSPGALHDLACWAFWPSENQVEQAIERQVLHTSLFPLLRGFCACSAECLPPPHPAIRGCHDPAAMVRSRGVSTWQLS